MRWKRFLGLGCLSLIALVVVTGIGLWIWKPWVPAIVVEAPGPGGVRVTEGGMVANYYASRKAGPQPALLVLGGSEGGLGTGINHEAQVLNDLGYPVLVMSYFRGPGQSSTLQSVPLEEFDQALAWLAHQPGVDPASLGVVGTSKGGEAALLIASRHPELKAVVAGVPSSVVWQGIDWDKFGAGTGSSWSVGGKPLPFVEYAKVAYSSTFRVADTYEGSFKALPANSPAIIPVEKSNAAIMLVCGDKDAIWPSCPMSHAVVQRLAGYHRPAATLLEYAEAGHAVVGPPFLKAPNDKDLVIVGGSVSGTVAARNDGWPKIVAHLGKALGKSH